MGSVGSRLVARLGERERREVQEFFEHDTTGSLTPPEDDKEENKESEEVDAQYAVEPPHDPMYFPVPDPVTRAGALAHLSATDEESVPAAEMGYGEDSAEFSDDDEDGYHRGLRFNEWDVDDGPHTPPRWEPLREQLTAIPKVNEPRGKASLVLGNDSTYTVSYSVIREDITTWDSGSSSKRSNTTAITSKKTARLLRRVAGKNTAVGRLLASMKKKEEAEEDTMNNMDPGHDDMGNFLMRGHRMAPMGETLPTEVLFPAGCEELRVLAYSRSWWGERGEWKQYMNKVYSIAGQRDRSKEKVFTIIASNSAVDGWAQQKSNTDVKLGAIPLGR